MPEQCDRFIGEAALFNPGYYCNSSVVSSDLTTVYRDPALFRPTYWGTSTAVRYYYLILL